MPTIGLRGTPTTQTLSAGQNITVPYPSGIVPGDIVYVLFGNSGTADGITTPTGWSQVRTGGGTTGNGQGAGLYQRIVDGTEGANQVFNTTASQNIAALCWALQGADSNTVASVAFAGDATTPYTTPTITPSSNGEMVIFLFVSDLTTAGTVNNPANTTQIGSATESGSAVMSQAAFLLQTTAAAITGDFTVGTAVTSGAHLATLVIAQIAQVPDIPYPNGYPRTDGMWTGPYYGPDMLRIEDRDDFIIPSVGAQTTDSDTAFLTLDATSAADTAQYVDSAQSSLNLVASATETTDVVDLDTAFLTLVTSSTEVAVFVDAALASLILAASAAEIAQYVDTDIATLLLVASALEAQQTILPTDIPNGGIYPQQTMQGPFLGPVGSYIRGALFGQQIALTNDFDTGQSDGTTITLLNSKAVGDNGFDVQSGNPTYSSAHPHTGGLSMGIVSGARYVGWNQNSLGYRLQQFFTRHYFNAPSAAGAITRTVWGDGDVTANLWRMTIGSDNLIRVSIAGGSAVLGSVAINLAAAIRIETEFQIANGVATVTARLYNTPESTGAPDDTITQSGNVVDSFVAGVNFGTASAWGTTVYSDDVAGSDVNWIGPLASVPTLTTDSDTAFLTLVTSGVDTAQYVDADQAALSSVASATEVHEIPDAATANLTLDATSAADTSQFVDNATATLSNVASGVDIAAFVDADIAALILTAGGVDQGPQTVDIPFGGVFPKQTMAGPYLGPVGRFYEERLVAPPPTVDAATCTLTLDASGSNEVAVFVDATTISLNLVTSVVETAQYVETATIALTLVTSAAEVATFIDAATGQLILDCSGSTEAPTTVYTDAATAQLTLTAGGTETPVTTTTYVTDNFTRSVTNGLGTAAPIGGAYYNVTQTAKYQVNGSKAVLLTDSTTDHSGMQSVGVADTDNQITFQLDAFQTGTYVKIMLRARYYDVGSGANFYAAHVRLKDDGTIQMQLDKAVNGTTIVLDAYSTVLTNGLINTDFKLRFLMQDFTLSAKVWKASDTEPTSWTKVATDSAHSHASGDNGFAASNSTSGTLHVLFDDYNVSGPTVGGGTTTTDADTGILTLVASGADIQLGTLANTVPLSLVASGIETIGDAATASLVLNSGFSLEDYYVDVTTVTFQLFASALEGYTYQDANTALLATTASAIFTELWTDTAEARLLLVAFDLLPQAMFVDSGTAILLLHSATFQEIVPVYDYYLATSIQIRYTTVAVGFVKDTSGLFRFDAAGNDRYVANGVGFDPRG